MTQRIIHNRTSLEQTLERSNFLSEEIRTLRRSSLPKIAVVLVIASFFCFYGLITRAYSVGPAILLLMSFFYIRGKDFKVLNSFGLRYFFLTLISYCIVQWIILGIHKEDITEFDLAFRYISASIVLVFAVKYPISSVKVLLFCAIGASLSGLYSIYQIEFLGVRRVHTFDNAIHFGNGAMALTLLCLSGLISIVEKRVAAFVAIGLALGSILGMYAVLASGTRGVWLAAPVATLVLVLLYWPRISAGKKVFFAISIAVVLGGGVFAQYPSIESRVNEAVVQYQDYFEGPHAGTSVGLRLDMWKAGFIAFGKNPVIGVGPAGVDETVESLVEDKIIHPESATFRHLHNQYIDILARQGMIGFASYVLFIFAAFYSFMKIFRSPSISARGHALAAAGIAIITQHLIVSVTISTIERSIGIMMFVFMIVFLLASAAGDRKDSPVES